MGDTKAAAGHESDAFIQVDWPCPLCAYNLKGLPQTHRCPECGFEYDPNAKCVPFSSRRRDLRELMIAGGLMAGWIGVTVGLMRGRISWQVLFVWGISLLPVLWRVAKGEVGLARLVVNRFGVRFDDAGAVGACVEWSRIAEARCGWVLGTFYLNGYQSKRLVRYSALQFGTLRRARECAAEINRLRVVYIAG